MPRGRGEVGTVRRTVITTLATSTCNFFAFDSTERIFTTRYNGVQFFFFLGVYLKVGGAVSLYRHLSAIKFTQLTSCFPKTSNEAANIAAKIQRFESNAAFLFANQFDECEA